MRRVAITGIGLVTAARRSAPSATWERAARGPQRGRADPRLRRRRRCARRSAREITDFEPKRLRRRNRRSLRMMTRNDQLAHGRRRRWRCRTPGSSWPRTTPSAPALFVGGNKEISNPMHLLEAVARRARRGRHGRHAPVRRAGARPAVYPLFFVEGLQAASLFYISRGLRPAGRRTPTSRARPRPAPIAIGRGFRAVRRGEADVAVAGGFDDADLLVEHDQDRRARRPDRAQRPRRGARAARTTATATAPCWARARRSSCSRSSRRRTRAGRAIYAEIAGFGSGFDADQLLTPHPEGAALALRDRARRCARPAATPDDVGYVAAHGSGTRARRRQRGARAARGVRRRRRPARASSVKAGDRPPGRRRPGR